jgi:hypothetical protein
MRSGEILGGSCFGQRPFKGELSKSESVNMTEFIGGRLPAVLNVNAILRHIADIQIFQAGLRGEYVRAQLSFGGEGEQTRGSLDQCNSDRDYS